jgi:Asp-tRNA(Asn)/Glu-tRNA(Gln) amidotransferase A subunit family amidase
MDVRIWRVVGEPLVAAGTSGALVGESVAVKDLFAVAGHAVGAGNPAYLAGAAVAAVHAGAVRALVEAGASIRGIARTDEFAYSVMGANAHYGTPPNPRAPERLPGGSSSGPATAVALGEAGIGLGTDTAGSVRVPASWQGLWGLRTTHGVVSREGLLPLAPSFDAVGWVTRSAEVLRRTVAASIELDGTAGDEFVVCPDLVGMADAGVRVAFEEKVRGLGPLREVRMPETAEAFAAFRTVQAAEAWRAHGSWVSSHPDSLGADVAGRFAWAATVTQEEEAEARAALEGFRERVDEALGDGVLVLPTTPTAAPLRTADAAELDAVRSATITMTCLASILGRPAISAPVLESAGAPVGLSLVGPRGSDLDLVARASGIANL